MSKLADYLKDPFLYNLYNEIRSAGALKSVSVDITSKCNLRCRGCYFFEEKMDQVNEGSDDDFHSWIESEKKRGTNMVTIVGGEPALQPGRIKKLYDHFKVNVATNGLIKIPYEGLENLPIGIAIWGDAKTDSVLRGNGKRNLFQEALNNYKNDQRAFWYYTVGQDCSHQIEEVVSTCINNGNRVLFNYYSDLSKDNSQLSDSLGFKNVIEEIDRLTLKYPEHILSTSYLNHVTGSGMLFDEQWGYNTCTNISASHPVNAQRVTNGNVFNPHFRAYNSDFKTVRRCCTGVERNCDSCYDTWEHFSWIMINMRKHLVSKERFKDWLSVMYIFYALNRIIDVPHHEFSNVLREIHSAKNEFVLTMK